MTEFLLTTVLVVLFVRWLVIRVRFADLEQKIQDASMPRDTVLDSVVATLTQRVYALEKELAQLRAGHQPELHATPVTAAEIPLAEHLEVTEPVVVDSVLPVTEATSASEEISAQPPPSITEPPLLETPIPEPARIPEPEPEPVPAGPTLSERLREQLSGEEWEAVVGGSLLNKIGALVLVIGIALFLGYSFTRMEAAGRAATGLAVSFALLGAGFFVERRDKYRVFARGLLGAGWASLYFTTYALHSVEATRIIDSPMLGAVLLIAVASAMIVHSLKYRSESMTGLAYFIAFATLGITQVTTLSVFALAPLAGSLLFIAARYQWSYMALFGLLATYGTCAVQKDTGSPAWQAQIIFSTYWLLFEAFDLMRARRRTAYAWFESAILPLNAIAFATLTYVKWSRSAHDQLYLVAACVAAAYLASAILRTRVCPPSSFDESANSFDRILSGGYEGPVTVTAILSAAAVLLKFHGAFASLGLLAEAEAFFLAGLWFGQAYLRQLAAALFIVDAVKLISVDIGDEHKTNLLGWNVQAWTPVTALGAALAYLNRFLRAPRKSYGYGACAVVSLIIGFETPERFLGSAWFVFGALLFSFGFARRLDDFRFQSYAAATLGVFGAAIHQINILSGTSTASRYGWVSLAAGAMLTYAAVWCTLRSAEDRFHPSERTALRRIGSWAVTVLAAALLWRVVPQPYLGVAWLGFSLVLLELGLRSLPADFLPQAYSLAAVGSACVFVINIIPIQNDGALLPRLIPAYAALAAYLIAARVRAAREPEPILNAASSVGTLFAASALWSVLPATAVGPAWAALSMLLVEIGLAFDLPFLRLEGHLMAASAFGRLFFANMLTLGSYGFLTHRLASTLPVAIAFYHQWARQREESPRLREWEALAGRIYLYAGSIVVFALLRFELGRVFAVAGWAAFTLALLWSGERWKLSDLRWQSYVVAVLAFVRSWTTNFYDPASLTGTAGRIGIAAFVIACLYAAQLIVPRGVNTRENVERYARLYFSMLATVLTTILLYHEVSGSVLTLAWSVEAVLLLAAGFPLMDRVLRLSGLFLFLVCILKLFFYDLRNLETLYRILSFIVLGLILLAVSWVYTKFRERIARFL